jgi:hypothetical protein
MDANTVLLVTMIDTLINEMSEFPQSEREEWIKILKQNKILTYADLHATGDPLQVFALLNLPLGVYARITSRTKAKILASVVPLAFNSTAQPSSSALALDQTCSSTTSTPTDRWKLDRDAFLALEPEKRIKGTKFVPQTRKDHNERIQQIKARKKATDI